MVTVFTDILLDGLYLIEGESVWKGSFSSFSLVKKKKNGL